MNNSTSHTWLGEIEIMRGIAIIAVVMIHLTGLPVRTFPAGSLSHTLYAVLNSFVQFAVPAFIFISALVLAYGARKRGVIDWKQFYLKRWWQVVVPYLVWTVIYVVYRVVTTSSGLYEVQSVKYWAFWLVFGKAYYHLYYLSIIIQFYVFFPVLFWFLQRIRWNLFILLPVALAAQVAIYWGNRLYFYHVFPYARPFIWYLFVILIGMWVGGNYERFLSTIRKHRTVTGAVTLGALLCGTGYIQMSVANYRGIPIDTFVYQMLWYFYVTAFSIVLLELSRSLGRVNSRINDFLRLAGSLSFGIYLIHPLLLAEWRRLVVFSDPVMFNIALWTSFVLVLALSTWLVRWLGKTRWNRVLFGR